MYKICDHTMKVLTEVGSLANAKEDARRYAADNYGVTYFVCNQQGQIVAGYVNVVVELPIGD